MSQLAKARRQANSIRTLIRQKKYLPAIQALYDTVLTMLKTPLMKSEREEFERLIDDGSYHIMADPTVRKSAALEIKYVPGQERELLDTLRMLLEAFQENIQEEAENTIRMTREHREREMSRGQALLDENNADGARGVFAVLARDSGADSEIRVEIGERFLKARQYADAVEYLGDALALNPDAVHIYNNLAMAQRKLGQFAQSEQSYLKAAQGGYKDSHLFFNMGRLYIDWQRWDKAVKAAKAALVIDPDFDEAKKLMEYAEKMTQKTS